MPDYFSTFRNINESSVETVTISSTPDVESTYVIVKEKDTFTPLINIKIPSGSFSPFKETVVINGHVLIGWADCFILFNLLTRDHIMIIFEDYFGNFRLHNNEIFVCSASDVTCLSMEGEIKWKSAAIAIDGIVINSFENEIVSCSCEWDPPGGWLPYRLDIKTGAILKT